MTDADRIFQRASTLRNQIERAKVAGRTDEAARLTAELDARRREARHQSIDPESAGEELLALRHELRKINKREGRAWFVRVFLSRGGGAGSADRWWTDTPPNANDVHVDARRRDVVQRIYELEEQLIAIDALGTFPPLAPNNINRWW